MASLDRAIAELRAPVTQLRHDIHRYPEPGFEETRTQSKVRERLESVGLNPQVCAETGLVADIGSGSGLTIALRADLDCLRMTEENHDLPYRSERDGLAHMCGHDGHTAVLTGVGQLLASVSDRLSGRVRLLFQPAEEGPGGAPRMIEEGALDGVDEVYAMHNWPHAPLGELRTIAGPCLATVAEFGIEVRGKGGHASTPHVTTDPVLAGAYIVSALQTIISRNVPSEESAVISVTTFHGGEAFNVIPDTAQLSGTVRSLSDDVYALIERRMHEVVTATAQGLGCEAKLDLRRMYPVLIQQ